MVTGAAAGPFTIVGSTVMLPIISAVAAGRATASVSTSSTTRMV